MRLYELTEQYETLLEMAQEGGEGVDYESMLQGMEGAISDKLDGYCKIIKTLEVEAAAVGAESLRLSQRKTGLENQVKRMKDAMKSGMIRLNMNKHQSTLFTVSVTSPRQRVDVLDTEIVPKKYLRIKKEVDKAAAMELLKSGKKIRGLSLVQGESGLSIK